MNCRNNNEKLLNNTCNCSDNTRTCNCRKCMGSAALAKECNCAGTTNLNKGCNCAGTTNLNKGCNCAGATNLNKGCNCAGATNLNKGCNCAGTTSLNKGCNYAGTTSFRKECNCIGRNTFDNECNYQKIKNNTKINTENCGCDRGNECVDEMAPAMGYVPWQKWEDVYCIEDAIKHGTIFKQLCKPFVGRCSK